MKLFLTTGSETQTFSFETFPVVIGSDSPPATSLTIQGLDPIHVKIIEKEGSYYIINEVNDPFLALNGVPFRKKKLSDQDTVEINTETSIRISMEKAPAAAEAEEIPKPKLKPIKIHDLDEQEPAPSSPQLGRIAGMDPIGFGKKIRFTCTVAGIILILTAFIASAFYSRAAETAKNNEIAAAEGVADIAMAFKHAQVHNLKPKKHNWSDPEFIKNNLAAVITHDCPAITNIDTHGQFTNCPYLLRTYASSDFSHFIVIAQPNPSMWHWLLPTKTIAVDSRSMELRKIDDIRTLNRLLIAGNYLDESEATEVTKLIGGGELIPLATLATRRCYRGYTPPKALALMHPGAENRIYNAPRYHHFGESIVRRALSMGANADNPSELARLRQEMQSLARFPDTVLYSSHGMEMAMQTRRALATILPDSHFLLGYLKYNADGNLVSSNLIFDQNPSEIVMYEEDLFDEEPPETEEWINIQTILENAAKKLEQNRADTKTPSLKGELEKARLARIEALSPLAEELETYLRQTREMAFVPEESRLEMLSSRYLEESRIESGKIRDKLVALYARFINLPFQEFVRTVRQEGLGEWLPSSMTEYTE